LYDQVEYQIEYDTFQSCICRSYYLCTFETRQKCTE
jgi:hypothetical protein